jgi:hypothetical protein
MAECDVFVSYSSIDVRIAQGLSIVLSRGGHVPWIDTCEVRAGEPVPESLRKALRSCRFLCAVITPNYGKSWYTRMEAELMKSREGVLAPVRVLPCLFSGELPAFIGERNYVDFRTSPQLAEQRLLTALASHRKVQDDRGKVAAVGGMAAAVALIAWAFSQESDEEIEKRRYKQSVLLGLANHHALGRILAMRDIPVPAKKLDRISAVLNAVPITEALDELFSSEELKAICEAFDVPVGRTKAERIHNILE